VAGRIRSIEKSNDLIGNQTHDLPACSIVPQSSTLPRAPTTKQKQQKKNKQCDHASFKIWSSLLQNQVVLYVDTDGSEKHAASVFNAEEYRIRMLLCHTARL
jgi:hypothetical protein